MNPSGKLLLSFPRRVKDNPTYLNYRSERGRTLYGEDIYVGYRYYEAVEQEVLFLLGYGLSYTSFSISDLRTTDDAETGVLRVSCQSEIQVRCRAPRSRRYISHDITRLIRRPVQELVGFNKVFLQPGEEKVASIEMQIKYAAPFWDEGRGMWIAEKDKYDILVGSTSSLAVELWRWSAFEGGF